jgi:nitroreductase
MSTSWHSILEVARHAPSPYNAQPWRLRVLDDATAEVYVERARTLPEEELTGRYLALSMGLFVESLRLVAAQRGLRLDDELAAANSSFSAEELDKCGEPHVLFARLALRPGARAPEFPVELLLARRTSRLPYENTPVKLEDARALAQLASSWGYRYTQTSNPERIEHLLEMSFRASEQWLGLPGCRNEIARWIRYTEREARTRGDGWDAGSLGLMPFDLFAAFRLPGSLRSMSGGDLWQRWFRDMGPVATMGVLSGAFQRTMDAYRAGGFLLHFWLECTRRGLFLQPFANLVTDEDAATRCEHVWRVPEIWLEFRIGRSPTPAKSHRRRVEEILLDEELPTAGGPPTSRASSDRRS